MKYNITCIPGDGIGPEIVAAAKNVLKVTGDRFGHEFLFTDVLMGGASIDAYGVPLTEETIEKAKSADAVLMADAPSKLCDAIGIARKAHRITVENIVFALGVKLAILVLATVGIATLWLAVFGDVGVAVLAILNAMRCMRS